MKKKEKAPSWAVLGILILYLLFSVIEFLGYLNIIHVNHVHFDNEFGEYCELGYYNFWCLLNVIVILFYGLIAISSVWRKWKIAVTIGASLIVCYYIINTITFLLELSATNYHELNSYMKIIIPMNRFLVITNIVGILLIVWNTRVSKVVMISITSYELLIFILGSVSPYFKYIDFSLYLIVGRPLISVALLAIFFFKSGLKSNYLTE